MRLLSVSVRNFKLLEDVRLEFSTSSQQPLTVIRAENGSGKTSFLNALLWAFYGMEGLPPDARGLRLTSAAVPAGKVMDVSTMIEFEHTDEADVATRYRLIRNVSETPGIEDKFDRGNDRVRLLRITSAGEEDVEPAEALIGKFVPRHLRDVFFTNGDDVQTFISGRVGTQQRQAQVHKAIQSLLGLDMLRTAAADIEAAFRALRAESAKSGGADVQDAEAELEKSDESLQELEAQRSELVASLGNMAEHRAKWDRELTGLRGVGDIEELNARITRLRSEISGLETSRASIFSRMRDAFRSEECSWALMGSFLEKGTDILGDLADRHVIPGTSVEVLTDRLELEKCICGEPLPHGSQRRSEVERLRDEQRKTSEVQQRLTALFHTARQSKANHDARLDETRGFATMRNGLMQEFTNIRDLLRDKGLELKSDEEKRRSIDEERVRHLADQLGKVEAQIAEANTKLGRLNAEIDHLEQIRQAQEARLREAEKAAKFTGDLTIRRDVGQDLQELAKGTLGVLEGDYVKRVSDRMAELFMTIVGSAKDFEAGVFKGVHIAKNYDIIVDTHDGRQLDPDFELNGASQRALTLSFIWALMEVSGTTAPRIIDSPLGFVAGGVKTRMIDHITRPPTGGLPDFQVVLLLTRSEIRDVEGLLDGRAGVVQTLSCSKDYPEDLVYNWEVDRPIIKACACSHRDSCRVCARRYDEQHGVKFVDK